MIYTLTLNPAIDKTVTIESFETGTVNRIRTVRTDIGGKGINVSKCLMQLGCKSTAAAFWGGTTGMRGVKFLEQQGIGVLTVQVDEDTRTNLKVIDPTLGKNTDINEPGPEITQEKLQELLAKLDETILPGDTLLLSGSIPRGIASTIYRDLIARYQQKGAKVWLDADGESFREGVKAAPTLIKPNIDELDRLMGHPHPDVQSLIESAEVLLGMGIREVVISLGGDGALFVKDGWCCKAEGLKVPVLSTVGAGDSMVAALAYGEQAGLTDEQRLKLAIAISAASVMCSGSQAPELATVERLYHEVRTRVL
ncbi:MAG: 1-phosphofructokinase [Clostridia bacterium]|nr:1-phosphofructokinase [Clostridia bacterium]